MHHLKYSNDGSLYSEKIAITPKHSHLDQKMSQAQPKKPQLDHEIPQHEGDVFGISSVLIDGDVQGKCVEHQAPLVPTSIGSAAIDGDPITIGEALEAVAISFGDKAVDHTDADAISAAEIRASGENSVMTGGVGETAQAAATSNSHVKRAQDMTKLSDILTDATEKLPGDRAVTKEDADAVYAAEVESPLRRGATTELVTEPGGVSASMATAANLNKLN